MRLPHTLLQWEQLFTEAEGPVCRCIFSAPSSNVGWIELPCKSNRNVRWLKSMNIHMSCLKSCLLQGVVGYLLKAKSVMTTWISFWICSLLICLIIIWFLGACHSFSLLQQLMAAGKTSVIGAPAFGLPDGQLQGKRRLTHRYCQTREHVGMEATTNLSRWQGLKNCLSQS